MRTRLLNQVLKVLYRPAHVRVPRCAKRDLRVPRDLVYQLRHS